MAYSGRLDGVISPKAEFSLQIPRELLHTPSERSGREKINKQRDRGKGLTMVKALITAVRSLSVIPQTSARARASSNQGVCL